MSAPAPSTKKEFLTRDESGLHARLETDRLVIRSLEDGDFPHILALQSNDQVMKFVGAGGAREEARIKRGFDFYRGFWKEGNPVSAYAVFSKNPDGSENEFMGMAALEEVRDKGAVVPGVAEPMLYFMPQFWRGGFGKEVGRGFVGMIIGLHESGLDLEIAGSPITKLIATASLENEASAKLQESLGFTYVGDREFSKGDTMVTKKLFEFDLSRFLTPRPVAGKPEITGGVKSDEVERV